MSKRAKRYFLPYELDAFGNAAIIGNACGLGAAQVVYGNLLMWQHVWRTKSDRVTTAHVRAFFGADACEALVLFNHLEASEDGWRVKGAAEWLRVMSAQSESGKRNAKNLIPGGPKGLGSPSAYPPKKAEAETKPIGSPSALPATSHQPPATSDHLKETTALLEREVFDHWVTAGKRNANTTLTDVRRLKVRARLREGYTVEQLKDAIDGCAVTPHNQGETDGRIHDDLELICRSAGHVDRFIRNKADPPRWKKPATARPPVSVAASAKPPLCAPKRGSA